MGEPLLSYFAYGSLRPAAGIGPVTMVRRRRKRGAAPAAVNEKGAALLGGERNWAVILSV